MGEGHTEARLVRALFAHFAATEGFCFREKGKGSAWRGLLEAEEETLLVLGGGGRGFVTLCLPLVVSAEFVDAHLRELTAVLAGYDVSLGIEKEGCEGGDVRLNLGLRIFLAGLNPVVFRLAVDNLRAARGALVRTFP